MKFFPLWRLAFFLPSLFVSGPVPPPSLASAPVFPTNLATLPPGPPPVVLLPSSLKKARFCLLHAKSFSTHLPAPVPVLPPMPIAIDNGLPHITFDLSASSLFVELCGLMGTCGALNTGYFLFHLWLKSKRPDLVAEFVSFNDANPFEPIKLGGAIGDPSDFISSDHVAISPPSSGSIRHRYHITLSFALRPDVTPVNTIFGLPMLCNLD